MEPVSYVSTEGSRTRTIGAGACVPISQPLYGLESSGPLPTVLSSQHGDVSTQGLMTIGFAFDSFP